MNQLAFLDIYVGQKILVTPLDWGLGHASRSAPIIAYLQRRNVVHIAAGGMAHDWLARRFPMLSMHRIPGLRIRYRYRWMWLNILLALPRLWYARRSENKLLQKIIQSQGFTLIIADHRLGSYSSTCPCVVIAHQVYIPHPSPMLSLIISAINRKLLNRYDEVWIPDYQKSELSLAGILANPSGLKKYRHIGPLTDLEITDGHTEQEQIDILILLSGPEPTRSALEQQLCSLCTGLEDQKIVLIRGSNLAQPAQGYKNFRKVIDLATPKEISALLHSTKIVICRSGYSTLMDLHYLHKKAILIPTPQQPEQVYLAQYHKMKGHHTISESELHSDPLALKKLILNELKTHTFVE